MARASKFTEGQRLEIALDMLSGKMSVPQVQNNYFCIFLPDIKKCGRRRCI